MAYTKTERLRDSANRLGQLLIWHCENTPLATWQAAIDEGCKLDYPDRLLHALHTHRPKRPPTAEEIAELERMLQAIGCVPLDTILRIATDPAWALFNLPNEYI